MQISRALLVDVTLPARPSTTEPVPATPAPVINVQPAPVTVQPAQPVINVQPAEVHVAPPTINVQPAAVNVSQTPTAPLPAVVPLPTKLRFLHVRDGYVSYDQIASVKVEQIGVQQPFRIVITTSAGATHYWSETYPARPQADLALDRIVWALGL